MAIESTLELAEDVRQSRSKKMTGVMVFLVDDEPDHLELMAAALTQPNGDEAIYPTLAVQSFIRPSEALAELPATGPVAVVCDFQMPTGSGLDWLPDFLRLDLGPVIVLTSHGNEQIAAQAFRMGASDYLVKSKVLEDPHLLRRTIRESVRRYQLERQNRQLATQLKLANAELKRNNRKLFVLNETAQKFVDNVSHEFRTPLTVIKGYAEAISEGLAGPSGGANQQAEFLNIIVDRTRDLAQMVDDMLDSSKLRAGTLRVDRRRHTVEEIMTPLRPIFQRTAVVNGIRLVEELAADLPAVFTDAEKTGRVVLNLTVNAVKFSPEGSIVKLWARPEEDGGVRIGVTDQGSGISAENLDALYQRFKQVGDPQLASAKGFGLGLNIAKELVALTFGEMSVQSQPRAGSTFSFTVPQDDAAVVLEKYLAYLTALETEERNMTVLKVEAQSRGKTVRGALAAAVRPTELILESEDHKYFLVVGCVEDTNAWARQLYDAAGGTAEIMGIWPYPAQTARAAQLVLEKLKPEASHD